MGIRLPRPSSAKTYAFINLIAVISITASGQLDFRKPDFDTGKAPFAVAAGDFNRDGHPDVVTANLQDNTISVLLSDGHGRFGTRKDYPVGGGPRAVIVADFNSDGILDIAVANHDTNSISVLLGNGNGGFTALPVVAVGNGPAALTAGDFNHDGKLDLAVVNRTDRTLGIYFGKGNGSFTHSVDYALGSVTLDDGFPSGIVTADFNHDGILDLAAADGTSSQVSVFLGKTDGSFVSSAVLVLPGEIMAGPIAAADFNADGNLDLLVQPIGCDSSGCGGGLPRIYGGNGDGTFDQGHEVFVPDSGLPIIVADVNGDGVPDIVTRYHVVLVNPAAIFAGGGTPFLSMAPAGLGVQDMVAGDFDGDGRLDIVTANAGDNTVSLLLGSGDGNFHQPQRFATDGEPDAIVVGDFNGDGFPDLAVGKEIQPGIQIFFGDGRGGFQPPVKIATDMVANQLAIADLNHDGIPDLLATGRAGNRLVIRSLLGRGDGTFQAPIDRQAFVGTISSLAVVDLNGDGIPDVVTLAGSNLPGEFLHVYLGNGDGTFLDSRDTFVGQVAESIAVGDFNNDGKMDVLAGSGNIASAANISVFLGNGDGTFRNAGSYFGALFGASLAVADFDHDGNLDFVSLPDLFLGNGDGTFRKFPGVLKVGPFDLGSFLHVADMNGDGLPDLVAAQGYHFSVLINNGDGTFQSPVLFAQGGAWQAALADFDLDGRLDIAAAGGFTNNSISLFLSGPPAPQVRDFRLELNPQSLTLTVGQSGSAMASVTALGVFRDQVTFSCAGLPAQTTCSFSPPSGTPSSAGGFTSAFTITTQAATAAHLKPFSRLLNGTLTLALAMPVFGLLLSKSGNRKLLLATLPLVLCALLFTGCGSVNHTSSNQPGNRGTPQGAYTVIVTATTAGTPAITHSHTFVLNIQ